MSLCEKKRSDREIRYPLEPANYIISLVSRFFLIRDLYKCKITVYFLYNLPINTVVHLVTCNLCYIEINYCMCICN